MEDEMKEKLAIAIAKGRKMMNRHLDITKKDVDKSDDAFTLLVAEYACACFYKETIRNSLKGSVMLAQEKAGLWMKRKRWTACSSLSPRWWQPPPKKRQSASAR